VKFVSSGLAHKAVISGLVAADRHEGSKDEYLATWHVYSYVCLHDKPLQFRHQYSNWGWSMGLSFRHTL